MKKGNWRLEDLPRRKISENLRRKVTPDSKLFALVYRTPGSFAHAPTDLYAGQLLWNPRTMEALVDMALQRVDTAGTPEEALSTALECVSVNDLSYVGNRYWTPSGPITMLKRLTGRD